MSKGSVTGLLFTPSSLNGTTLLFSQFTVRALVNRFPNFIWITDVIFNLRFLKIGFSFFGHIVSLLLKRFALSRAFICHR